MKHLQTMGEYMTAYQQRVNAERLARRAEDVKRPAKEILNSLKSIEQYLYWALDPDEKDGGAYYALCAIEHAHTLLDLTHDYRAALKANPMQRYTIDGTMEDGSHHSDGGAEVMKRLVFIEHALNTMLNPRYNPVAKDLRTPKYAPRIIPSKKIYNRKRKMPK